MGLETATYIDGLVATNPVGATDTVSTADDHLRLIKSTLLATFPNVAGAMTASHTELNALDGVTGATGTGDVVLNNAPDLTGAITGDATLNTDNASASEIGYRGAPVNNQTDSYGLVLADAGKVVTLTAGASKTFTIPANISIAFPVGTVIGIANSSGNPLSVAITSDTLTFANGGGTGTRTLTDDGEMCIRKRSSTEWICYGVGIT